MLVRLPRVRQWSASTLAVVLAAAFALVGLPVLPAQAAGIPDIALSKSAPTSVLLGAPATYQLTVTNPTGPGAAFNVSFRDVLPVGVTYVAGSTTPADVGDPTIIADQPAVGQTTLIWRNVADVQQRRRPHAQVPGDSRSGDASRSRRPSPTRPTAYASSDPRQVPRFDARGVAVPDVVHVQRVSDRTTDHGLGLRDPQVRAEPGARAAAGGPRPHHGLHAAGARTTRRCRDQRDHGRRTSCRRAWSSSVAAGSTTARRAPSSTPVRHD